MEGGGRLFADTKWCARDLTDRWRVCTEEAEEILARHESRLSEVMCMAGWQYLEIEAMEGYEERDEDEVDTEADLTHEETVEGVLVERKIAFARWSFAKPGFVYQGEYVSLCGGPDEDEIEYEGELYVTLDEVLDAIDEIVSPPDVQDSVKCEWRAWLGTDEARRVHLGQHSAG